MVLFLLPLVIVCAWAFLWFVAVRGLYGMADCHDDGG